MQALKQSLNGESETRSKHEDFSVAAKSDGHIFLSSEEVRAVALAVVAGSSGLAQPEEAFGFARTLFGQKLRPGLAHGKACFQNPRGCCF